jgi:tripartite-type tricarboxylate transporter receptor subunit TctC
MPQHKAGKIRALAVSSRDRSSAAPELPTVAESGVKGFEVSGWYGIVAPARTPRPVLERLNRELTAIVAEPAIRERLVGQGLEPIGRDGAVFGELIRREKDIWHRLVTEKNIRAD